VQERDGLLTAWLNEHAAQAVVARPDHYVYGVATTPDMLRQVMQGLACQLSSSSSTAM
jgi:3-(3-hydroxy-phenyl)propionate hydroxylase